MSNSFWGPPPMAIAHRGGDAAGNDKENTLAAFQAAQKLGYKYGETDVILAASGELVAFHGSRNRLQARIKGDISRRALQKMTLSQIRKMPGLDGQNVATLEELLAKLPNMKFFIDPKTDEAVLPLANLLKKLKALDKVCVGSFYHDRVKGFIKLARPQNACAGLIIGRGLRFTNKNLLLLKSGRLNDLEAVSLHHSLVSPQMIGLIQKQGMKALIWTCNSPLAINNAINCGADGIISDRVELLKQVLVSQN